MDHTHTAARILSWLGPALLGVAAAQQPAPQQPDPQQSTTQQPAPQQPVEGRQPRVAWIYSPNASFEQLLLGGDRLFALDRSGRLHCIDPTTGDARWVSDKVYGFGWDFGITMSTVEDFPALLVGSDQGLYALDPATGERKWHTALPKGANQPACAGEVVVAAGSDGVVYGCDLRTGEMRWQADCLEDRPDDPPGFDGKQARFDGRPARPGAATTDGTLVTVPFFDQCRVVAFDAATGARRWSFATQGWVYPAATMDPRYAYVASQDHHLYAVDKELGKEAWRVETKARNEGAVTPTGRFAYFGSCDGHLYAVDTGVGRVAWQFQIEANQRGSRPLYSQPLVHDDVVYLAAMPGVVYAIDRQSGELRWQLRPLPMSELAGDPLRLGNRLFVSTRTGAENGASAVIAIDLP